MKVKFGCMAIGLALLGGLAQSAEATVAFTVTPSTVSNTYNGTITIQVTGLTNSEPVVVQKYLDANTNGVIDGSDLLWQQFTLTDGVNFVIGGVTNINVPGDTDGTANGTITATLYLQPDFAQTIVGSYLFKLSSPNGNFTPLTCPFTVTNFPYSQKFTGTVASNGVAVPNAVVIMFEGSNQNLNTVGGTVANNAGLYTIAATPGTYLLASFKTNFVADATAAANLVLGAAATIDTNLNLAAATQSISGKIVDSSNPGLGLPGILAPAQTQNGLIAIGFSDTNGSFSAAVTPDQWQIQGDSGAFALHGYLELQNGPVADTTTGSVTGVTIALPRATALFYGTVRDNFGNPLPGMVAVEAADDNGLYIADGYTDANGYYVTAALGGLGAGDPWQVQVDNQSSYPNYIFSRPAFDQNGNGTNISAGQVVLANITAILATNHIGGNVKCDGTNLVNLGVYANATIGGAQYSTYTDTDNNGNYSLNVPNGNWTVGLNQNNDNDSLDNILGGGNYAPPNEQSLDVSNNTGTVNFTVQTCDGVQITTASPLPNAQQGTYYSIQLQASACNNTFTWSVNDPADFPPGLTLYPGGPLNGTPTTNGVFHFSVHVDDNNGHATDTNYSLTINRIPVLASPTWLNHQFQMRLNGAASQNYTLQMSTNLSPPAWVTLFITNNPATNSFFLIDPNATNKQRFYRILLGP